jgi:hypothetical protein
MFFDFFNLSFLFLFLNFTFVFYSNEIFSFVAI